MSNDRIKLSHREKAVSGFLLVVFVTTFTLVYYLGQATLFLCIIGVHMVAHMVDAHLRRTAASADDSSKQVTPPPSERPGRVIKLDYTSSLNPMNRWSFRIDLDDKSMDFKGPCSTGIVDPGVLLTCVQMVREVHGIECSGNIIRSMDRQRDEFRMVLWRYRLLLAYAKIAEKYYDARKQELEGRIMPSYVEALESELPEPFHPESWIPLPKRYPYDMAASPYEAVSLLQNLPADLVVDDLVEGNILVDRACNYEERGVPDFGSFFRMVELRLVTMTETRIAQIRAHEERWTTIIQALEEDQKERGLGGMDYY